jgi:hypothetical protein
MSVGLRYVVLHHTGVDDPHYDLMFETESGSALKTFRLARWPVEGTIAATPLPDHRREYLDYEGAISGGRGNVRRVATGGCIVLPIDIGGWRLEMADRESSTTVSIDLSNPTGVIGSATMSSPA